MAQQLGEMDYVEFHVHRIADDLQRAGVPISSHVATPTICEPEQETKFTIASGHKSKVYLPHWIRDHRDDPALTVSLFVIVHVPNTHVYIN